MAQIILDSNNNLIQGDFDNATLNNRTKLQTTTTNATTNVYVVPNGSSTSAGVSVANNSSLTNASKIVMATNGTTDTQIISGINGSGTYLPMSFYTNNALAMQITTGGIISAAGGGIQFPATQIASADANTLDDYEEGTWTPTITGVSTYTTQNAVYTKIGKFVTVYGEIDATDPGGLAAFDIASLPFAIQSTVVCYPVGNVFPVIGWTSNATALILQGTPGFTKARVYWLSSGATNYNNITSSDLAATFNVEFSLSYISTN
jgi:hypothetical protein